MQKLTICLAVLILASSSYAASIAVNLTPHNDTEALSVLASTDVTGKPGVAQDNWNNFTVTHNNNGDVSGSMADLVNDSNATTTAGVAVEDLGTAYMVLRSDTWGYTGADFTMHRGVVLNQADVLVTDVPYAEYDVYVYMFHYNAGNEGVQLTLGDAATGSVDATQYFLRYNGNTPYTVATDTVMPVGSNPGYADTVVFTGNTASSFRISAVDGSLNNAGIAGFQIVATTIPEPATMSLLGAGVLALVRRRR